MHQAFNLELPYVILYKSQNAVRYAVGNTNPFLHHRKLELGKLEWHAKGQLVGDGFRDSTPKSKSKLFTMSSGNNAEVLG